MTGIDRDRERERERGKAYWGLGYIFERDRERGDREVERER